MDTPEIDMESLEPSEQPEAFDSADDVAVEETSAQYLGRWNHLVSTTNWEKGRIISEWRGSLLKAARRPQTYSDEAWSRRVGNVSPQHVGRLRRVYERFSEVAHQYAGLYWSHFQAALDWHDAEMWLEGAVQNGWSVSGMRSARWEATGGAPGDAPLDAELVCEEMDGDAPVEDSPAREPSTLLASEREVRDLDQDDDSPDDDRSEFDEPPFETDDAMPDVPKSVEPLRPFENLPHLPPNLADAFEAFKLAILSHKVSGWQEVACGEVIAALDALKQLALAPSEA